MMSFKASLLYLIILLMISGALGNEWSVKYSQQNLCALKGSTVFMNSTYTHPTDLTVVNRFWHVDPVKGDQPKTELRNESGYSGRVEYLEDKQQHFILRLSDVKKTDEHMYCVRIITNTKEGRFTGYPGVILNVTDLQVIVPAVVTEGQSAVLTCKTTCNLTDPTFIWYKTSHDLPTKTSKSSEVHLQSVSSEDAGSYRCAVRGSEHLHSPPQTLTVRYPPKHVSVSISSSGEIEEGSSVNLTCSSDANPPVENYTWFQVNKPSPVGSGQSYRALQSGQYYCEAQNEHGFKRSAAVSVNLNSSQSSGVYAGLGAAVFVCVCLIITFIVIWKKKRTGLTTTGSNQDHYHSNAIVTEQISTTISDSTSACQDEVRYATVAHQSSSAFRNNETSKDEEVQYATVGFTRTGTTYRSSNAEDPAVIYSSVK